MEEQQVNTQPTNESQSNSALPANVLTLDIVSGVFAAAGAVASVVTQQMAFAAVPLAVSVGVHLYNRKQSVEALDKYYDHLIRQQNVHIVDTEEKLQTLTGELTQFKVDSQDALAQGLEQQAQVHLAKVEELLGQITQLQERALELGQTDEGLREYIQALEGKHLELADVVAQLKQIENYSQALQTNPSAADLYYLRGQSHEHLGDKEGAIHDYTQAIRADGHYAKAYHSRGLVLLSLNQRKKAIDDLRQAYKLYFEQEDIDNYQKVRALAKEVYDLSSESEKESMAVAQDEFEGQVPEGEKIKIAVSESASFPLGGLFSDSDDSKMLTPDFS